MVDAATIVHDSMAHLLETLDEAEQKEFFGRNDFPASSWNVCDAERRGRTIKYLSFTISKGLNMTFAESY